MIRNSMTTALISVHVKPAPICAAKNSSRRLTSSENIISEMATVSCSNYGRREGRRQSSECHCWQDAGWFNEESLAGPSSSLLVDQSRDL